MPGHSEHSSTRPGGAANGGGHHHQCQPECPEWQVALPAQSEFHLQSAKCTDFVAGDSAVRVKDIKEGVTGRRSQQDAAVC